MAMRLIASGGNEVDGPYVHFACPVCGGWRDPAPPGEPKRGLCKGRLDGMIARCTSRRHKGELVADGNGHFRHVLEKAPIPIVATDWGAPARKSMKPSELAAPLGPKKWISEGLTIQAGGRPVVLVGPGGSRKSWLSMAMQICGALSMPLLGFALKPGLRSVYLDWEQTPEVTQERYQRLARGYGVELRTLDDSFGYEWQPCFSLAPRDELGRNQVISELCRITENRDVAFVDSVFSASGCVQENSGDASIPFRIMTAVSVRTGVTFVALDHSGKPAKPGEAIPDMYAQRGHSSKGQQSQTIFNMHATFGAPTRVSCSRSQGVEDKLRPAPFRFTIEAKGTGSVLALAGAEREAPVFSSDALEDVKRRVLRCVEANPHISGRGIVARVQGGTELIRAAYEELADLGLLANQKGTKGRPRWIVKTPGVSKSAFLDITNARKNKRKVAP